jgi:pimeloyl-ACP methyl ester carboxylesterase
MIDRVHVRESFRKAALAGREHRSKAGEGRNRFLFFTKVRNFRALDKPGPAAAGARSAGPAPGADPARARQRPGSDPAASPQEPGMNPRLARIARGGRRLATRHRTGSGPTLVFLPGYASDMAGAKATALDAWAAAQGRAMLRFDYGGCGASEGDFGDETLASWRDDALAMIDRIEGPVVLVGSSMGGWLMLLAALARPERVKALVGIAAAPDFTAWGYTNPQKRTIRDEGRLAEPNPHGDAPTVTTRGFWESGEALRLLGDAIGFDGPVRLLHGLDDRDVPWRIALETAGRLRSADVQTVLVKGGDHRLSRAGDLALLTQTLAALLERL